MELRLLRHFTALARHLNYVRAAEELGISQPTLTRSIQALERELGLRLVDRGRAGVELTAHGKVVSQRAGLVLADVYDLEHQSKIIALGGAGRVNFGIAPMPGNALLPGVLSERIAATPDATNGVVVRDVQALWRLLVARDIEFFVSQDGLLPDTSQARIDFLGMFPLSLLVRAGHPLLEGDCPERRFPILRSSWAGLPLPPQIRERVRSGMANVIEEFGSLAQITAATDAIWFTSAHAASSELAMGTLRELPIDPEPPLGELRIVMYSLSRRTLSPLAHAMRKTFRAHIRKLNQDEQPHV